MSDTETNILLPTAGVDFFLKDKQTMEAARNISDDWRFARVAVSVEEGDVETAIQTYQNTASPALIIIETDTTDESFSARLEKLAEYCAEGTNAVVIGPVNDVNLYRQLTAMGVRDYLVRPVAKDILSEVIAHALVEKLGASGSRLIAVTGAKGGVGVTALTQALAWGLSENLKQKTFLLDSAGGWSSLGVGMGFEPTASLMEAVRAAATRDEDTIKRMLVKPNDKLSILGTGMESLLDASVPAQQYEELLDMVMASYPVVLVDLSASVPSLKRTVMNRAHEILLVTTPTLSSLRTAKTLMGEMKALHGGTIDNVDLVLNMVGMASGKEITKGDVQAALGVTPAASINFDPKLFVGCESDGSKMTSVKGGGDVVAQLLPLAEKILGENNAVKQDNAESGFLGSFFNKLKK